MRWHHRLVAACLAALWLPVLSHCLLEDLGVIHHDACCSELAETSDHGHDAADGVCRIESGGYKLQDNGVWTGEAVPLLWCCLMALAEIREPELKPPEFPGTSPPEWQASWQFSLRAALPVRAPSLAS